MGKQNDILDKIRIWWKLAFLPIALVILGFHCWFVYYKIELSINVSALKTSFINDATYDGDEDTFFMEVNIFNNCVEYKWNYYIDTSLPKQNEDGTFERKYMFSTGAQFYSQKKNKNFTEKSKGGLFRKNTRHWYEATNCTFYTTPDGIDYGYVSPDEAELCDQNKWVWDIGGKLCQLRAIGDVKYDKVLWKKHYLSYDANYLMYSNMDALLSFKEGVTITYFDMSKFFRVAMYDEETGKFGQENVGVDKNILDELTFVAVKVTKHDRDMVSAKQSVFKSYKGDTNWEADGSDSSLQYWQDYTIYNSTSKDFQFISAGANYNIELKSSCVSYLSAFSNSDLVIRVNINIDDFGDVVVIGFTDKPFKDLNVLSINLVSSNQVDFSVPQNTWTITTTNINLIERGAVA